MYELEKDDIGESLMLNLCTNHKIELCIKDSFNEKSSVHRKSCDLLNQVYYLFKKATFKWRLMKQHCTKEGEKLYCFKRPKGVRWVEHQINAIDVYFKNTKQLIIYCDEQINEPHKEKHKLVGIRNNIRGLTTMIFMAVKYDVLRYILPISQKQCQTYPPH